MLRDCVNHNVEEIGALTWVSAGGAPHAVLAGEDALDATDTTDASVAFAKHLQLDSFAVTTSVSKSRTSRSFIILEVGTRRRSNSQIPRAAAPSENQQPSRLGHFVVSFPLPASLIETAGLIRVGQFDNSWNIFELRRSFEGGFSHAMGGLARCIPIPFGPGRRQKL